MLGNLKINAKRRQTHAAARNDNTAAGHFNEGPSVFAGYAELEPARDEKSAFYGGSMPGSVS
ncbi:hypothetical protein EMIT074MI3_20245 [Bacillus licheniformis]